MGGGGGDGERGNNIWENFPADGKNDIFNFHVCAVFMSSEVRGLVNVTKIGP